MELFDFLGMLFTSNSPNFIKNSEGFNRVPIYMWIASSISNKNILFELDKTLFLFNDKEWFLYAWSLCRTIEKPQRFTFLKQKSEENETIQLVVDKARNKLKVANNDWVFVKDWIYSDVEQHTLEYAQMFGLDKRDYKKLGLEYEKYEPKKEKNKSLDSFF